MRTRNFKQTAHALLPEVWWPAEKGIAGMSRDAMPLRRSRADFATYARHVATGLRRSRDVFATFARQTPLRLSRDTFATVARRLCHCRATSMRPAHLQCLAFSSIHLPSSSGDGTCNCPTEEVMIFQAHARTWRSHSHVI